MSTVLNENVKTTWETEQNLQEGCKGGSGEEGEQEQSKTTCVYENVVVKPITLYAD